MSRNWPVIITAKDCPYCVAEVMCKHPKTQGPCALGYCPALGFEVHKQLLKQREQLQPTIETRSITKNGPYNEV